MIRKRDPFAPPSEGGEHATQQPTSCRTGQHDPAERRGTLEARAMAAVYCLDVDGFTCPYLAPCSSTGT